MDIRPLADNYAVSPMIEAADIPAIKEAGYTTILCNRPDEEVPVDQQVEAMKAATLKAGLSFVVNPVTHHGLNQEMVALQGQTIADSDGPVFAYCASGTRCTIVWALSQAGHRNTDDIIAAAQSAGYDIAGLRGQLDMIASRQ